MRLPIGLNYRQDDFSESNPGMIFLELASYVGDVLSFYTDTQVQETFIESAKEKTNLLSLAYNLGYKPSVTNPSTTDIDLYIQIPSTGTGDYPPDWTYAITINKNSIFKTGEADSVSFLLDRDVNFQVSSSLDPTEVLLYDLNGNPLVNGTNAEHYLLKKSAKVISAEIKTSTFTLGDPTKFLTLEIPDKKIIGIESITDSDGNIYVLIYFLTSYNLLIISLSTRLFIFKVIDAVFFFFANCISLLISSIKFLRIKNGATNNFLNDGIL